MKIKSASDMTAADAKAYRKRRDDITKGAKRIEGEIRDRLKKKADLDTELRKINAALLSFSSRPPARATKTVAKPKTR